MFSKKTNLKGIGPRLILSTTLLLTVSLLIVASIVYLLLARTLRQSDQNLLLGLHKSYSEVFLEGGGEALRNKIAPDILISIVDRSGNVVFEKLPSHIDHDFEDEDEIRQLEADVKKIPLKEGWTTILLLSGEEDNNLYEKFEYQLRLLASKRHWETVLPIIDNDLFEIYVTPLSDQYWMKIGKSSEEREEHLATIRYITLFVLIPFLFIGILMSALLARSVLKPIRDLAKTITRIKAGKPLRGKTRNTGDEIDFLTEELNSLLDRNETLIESLKQTLDNVAHEVRTPLTRFRSGAEAALVTTSSTTDLKEALQDGLENSDKILQLLNAILDTTEAESDLMKLKLEPVKLTDLFADLEDLYRFSAEERGVSLIFKTFDDIVVLCERGKILQAFSNIIDNALKYSTSEPKISVESEIVDQSVLIKFKDNGIGIPEENLGKIWNRLYRGDKARSTQGLGIGLSLVKAIIERHQGSVWAESAVGSGTTIFVTLPLCNVLAMKG